MGCFLGPVGSLYAIDYQAHHRCVVCKLNDGVGVMRGHTVVSAQGVQEGAEHSPLGEHMLRISVAEVLLLTLTTFTNTHTHTHTHMQALSFSLFSLSFPLFFSLSLPLSLCLTFPIFSPSLSPPLLFLSHSPCLSSLTLIANRTHTHYSCCLKRFIPNRCGS